MTLQAGEEPHKSDWDGAFSEFSNARLLPPSQRSVESVMRIARPLLAGVKPTLFQECALYNGELGFTFQRDEGDIMHIVRKREGPEAETAVTWYRGSFEDRFDSYVVSDGEVTSHMTFALAMQNAPSAVNEEMDFEDLVFEDEKREEDADPKTEDLLGQLNAISGLEENDQLETAIATALVAYGTKTQKWTQYHRLTCDAPTQDSVHIEANKRQYAPQALRLAPRFALKIDQLMGASGGGFRQFDILRLLENGGTEYESHKDGLGQPRSTSSYAEEVVRRHAARAAVLEERRFGIQEATQEHVDWVKRNLKGMLPYIRVPKPR